VVLTAQGYPGKYKKGESITGLENVKDSIVFHAGTKLDSGKIVSNGGRVMAVTSYGVDIPGGLKKSYKSIDLIDFKGKSYRKDIGFDLVKEKA
jgi:phosphoribosylamine--glycine ligase